MMIDIEQASILATRLAQDMINALIASTWDDWTKFDTAKARQANKAKTEKEWSSLERLMAEAFFEWLIQDNETSQDVDLKSAALSMSASRTLATFTRYSSLSVIPPEISNEIQEAFSVAHMLAQADKNVDFMKKTMLRQPGQSLLVQDDANAVVIAPPDTSSSEDEQKEMGSQKDSSFTRKTKSRSM